MGAPGFWDEPETAQKTAQAVTQLKEEVETFRSLETRVEDMEVLCELALEEDDESLLPEMEETLVSIRTDVEHLELGMLLNGEYDANNAILTLHAGAGGTEAQDWTSMLLRMFSRFAEREGYEVEMLDYLPGDEAGVKSATLQINGHNAYGYLRSEKGVHRLVRISPFDANARRHTSFAAVDVMPELDDSVAIDINPADLKVDTYRNLIRQLTKESFLELENEKTNTYKVMSSWHYLERLIESIQIYDDTETEDNEKPE